MMGWLALGLMAVLPRTAWADEPTAPDPRTPPVTAPSAIAPAQDVDERFRRMEEMNRRLSEQLEADRLRHDEQMRLLLDEIATLRGQGSGTATGGSTTLAGPARATPASTSPTTPGSAESNVPSYRISGTTGQKTVPLVGRFGNGFEFLTEDEEFQLQIHQETQADYRMFHPNGETFARDSFVFPRVRIFFNGRLTKQWEYMFSLNRGFGTLDILDAWINYHPSDAFQVRVGRFMTPFNYEQYAVQNMWLIAPERSLFTSNLGLNRMIGAQVWGYLWQKRLDYAVGVFDGPRNSYEDFNRAKDVMAYLNLRPFENGDSILKNLNFGGSFTYGMQDNPLLPQRFRVAANVSNAGTADTVAPPFFQFNPNVVERGDRAFWSGHIAYFYKQLSVLSDYNGAILRYAPSQAAAKSVTIPTDGWSISAGYFLTGEEVQRRTILDPLRPFDLRHGSFGLGAVELIARYNILTFSPDLLSKSLTDPTKWTDRAWGTNLGVNWYLNRYLKVYLDWQHSEFGSPVFYSPPDRKQIANEMVWLRLQLYF
jgi:phosphate-selective porin OprO/OprP